MVHINDAFIPGYVQFFKHSIEMLPVLCRPCNSLLKLSHLSNS